MSRSLESVWPRVVGHAWASKEYLNRLVADPGAALAEAGYKVPEGHEMVVLCNSPGRSYLVIPEPPAHIIADAMTAISSVDAASTKPDCCITADCCVEPGVPKPDCCVTPDCCTEPDVPKPDCCVTPDCSVDPETKRYSGR
jgi:hypothetical protein